jgi:predicted nucleic acid-binding protein
MGKKKIILCDTDVLIEYFHGEKKTVEELDYLTFERLGISPVTVGEIYFGMRKRETAQTKDLLSKFNVFHFDKEISRCFIELMLGYKGLGLKVPDAIIAATALTCQIELFTYNRKDYDFIRGINLYNPKF